MLLKVFAVKSVVGLRNEVFLLCPHSFCFISIWCLYVFYLDCRSSAY